MQRGSRWLVGGLLGLGAILAACGAPTPSTAARPAQLCGVEGKQLLPRGATTAAPLNPVPVAESLPIQVLEGPVGSGNALWYRIQYGPAPESMGWVQGQLGSAALDPVPCFAPAPASLYP